MRFIVDQAEKLSPEAVAQSYMAGIEGTPRASVNSLVGAELFIDSSVEESGTLSVPWPTDRLGTLTLMTSSLVQREQPYQLEVELARGTVHRLREYMAMGRFSEISIPTRVTDVLDQATLLCGQAVTLQGNRSEAASRAIESIEKSLEAIEDLCRCDSEEGLKLRLRLQPAADLLLGFAGMESVDPETLPDGLVDAFNLTTLPTCWKTIHGDPDTLAMDEVKNQIAWCHSQQLKVMAGPIISFQETNLPDSLYKGPTAFSTWQSECRAFTKHCVEQLKDDVDVWHAAAGLNQACHMGLSEEQCVRLAIDAVESIRQKDSRTPVVVSFEQPWGEYLSGGPQELSPIHFADALVRADLGINGIGLEINWQPGAGNTQPRDLVALSQQLDSWSTLQLPVLVFLTTPTGSGSEGETQEAGVANRVEQLMKVILSRPGIQAVIWNQLQDTTQGPRCSSGLLDQRGTQKPVMQAIQSLGQQLKTS